jgi:glucose uptake protein
MLIPTSYLGSLVALAVTALLWGLWAMTQRADRKWRFEMYAFDFALGVLASSAVLAMTLGNAGSGNTFTFDDNMVVASKRAMALAVGGGLLICVGNLMMLAGIVLAGMSTALPAGAGMALAAAVGLQMLTGKTGNPGLAGGGAGAAALAVLVMGLAQNAAAAAAPVKKGMHPGWKGFVLSLVGGLFVAGGLPVVESGRGGDIGVGPYGAALFLAFGLVLMTPLVALYFINLPVQGQAVGFKAYLQGTRKQHLLGLAGGMLWGAGTFAFFVGTGATYTGAPKFLGMEAVGFSGAVIGGLAGLTVWAEQAASGKAKGMLVGAMAVLGVASALVFLGS